MSQAKAISLLRKRLNYLFKNIQDIEAQWFDGRLAWSAREELGAIRKALFIMGESVDNIPNAPPKPEFYNMEHPSIDRVNTTGERQ